MTPRREDGFALVTTLWFLALLALVAVVVEGWISAALERATALQERVESRAALIGATDHLALVMVTSGFSARGIEVVPQASEARGTGGTLPPRRPSIALDGRPYRLGSVTVRLQDEGGLYDLSNPARDTLEKLLLGYGVAPSVAENMTAALVSYARKPSNVRAAGASRDADYTHAGLPAPRHAPLLTPWEPYRILGWRQKDALWRGPSSLGDIVTTGPIGGLNINAAPAKILAALTGMDEREAARVVAARTLHPITELGDLPGGLGEVAAPVDRPLTLLPSNIIRLKLSEMDDPLVHIVSIRLTPGAAAPYRIDYVVDLPADAATPAAPEAPTLPAIR